MSRPVIVLPQRARPTTKKDFNNQTRTNYQTWLSNDTNKKQQQDWEGTQEKAFTRWVNARLEPCNISVNSVTKDLADGLVLHALIEQLSGLKFKINNSPKMRVHMTENVSVCLNILQKEGLKLTGIGAPNIVDGDKKLVLGLLANLIEFYQLAEDRQAREGQEQLTKQELKNELLEWCKGYLPQYNIQNFTSSWQSGKEICALVEAVRPGTLDVPNCFSDDPVLDAFLGIDAATEHMKIPPLIDASDMVEKPDDLAMMAYLSYFRHYANRPIEAVVVKTNDDKLGAGKKTGPEIAVTPCVIMTPVADQPMTIYKVVSQDPDFDKSKIGFTGTDGKGQPAKCEVNNSGYGVHEMVFTPTVGGNHTFKITYDGKPCGGIPQEGVSIEFPNPEKPKEAAPVRPTARPTNNAPTQRRENFATVAFLEKVNDKSLNNKNNYMVMIDKSSSMKAPAKTHRHRWGQSSVVVASLTTACLSTSPEGISVFFFGSKGKLDYHQGIKSQQQVVDMFTKTKPFGTTCLEGALSAGFKVHFARDVQARMTIPTVILVITDGEPDSKSAVVDEIISASKKCKGPGELSISFLQVGDDAMCDAFFKKLNKPKSKAKYANVAVDCLSYSQINNIDEFVSASLH